MNIWFLTSEYPPEGGGIGTYVRHAARMFAEGGHNVTVLKPGRQARNFLADGSRFIEFVTGDQLPPETLTPDLEPDRRPAFPYNIMNYWPALSYQFAAELKQGVAQYGRPDIIEVQDYGAIGYYTLLRRLLQEEPYRRIPVVVHLHGPLFEMERVNLAPRYKLPNYWIGQMEKFCIGAADGLVSPSGFLAEQIQSRLGKKLPVTVIPYPAAPITAPEAEPVPGDVVYFGRVDYLKGSLQLVEGCRRLWRSGQNFKLTLIGGDNTVKGLNQSAKQYIRRKFGEYIDAGQLVICDPLPPAELHRRVARAWCVVIPSLYENFPNTCIEAMALGKLVVASRSGGQAEMIGEQAGLLFDWDIPGDFEAALNRALAMPAAENQAIGELARRRVGQLTAFEQVLPLRLSFYQDTIHRSQAPRTLYPAALPGIAAEPDRAAGTGLLSVVIPFYNLGRYLPETMGSIHNSTYSPLEVIIVDDGSTDPDSRAVLDRITDQQNDRLRLILADNQGVACARNLGAEHAKGEFLAFIDADDTVEPEFFARAIGVLQQYRNVSFVYSWLRYFGAATGCWVTFGTEFPFFLGHNMVNMQAVVRRDHFLQYGRQRPNVVLEDYDGWLGMAAAGCLGVSLPDMLTNYRIRAESRHQSQNYDQWLQSYDFITHNYAGLYREHALDLINLLLANGPAFAWNHPASDQLSPLEQLETLNHRYQVELGSQDFVTRHFIRLTLGNIVKTFRHPSRAWQRFQKWYHIYLAKDRT